MYHPRLIFLVTIKYVIKNTCFGIHQDILQFTAVVMFCLVHFFTNSTTVDDVAKIVDMQHLSSA